MEAFQPDLETPDDACCDWIAGIFSSGSPAVPVFGTQSALLHLNYAIWTGLHVQPDKTGATSHVSEALSLAVKRVIELGTFPIDSSNVSMSLTVYLAQHGTIGEQISNIRTLDTQAILHALRCASAIQEQKTSKKHVYQLGVLSFTEHCTLPALHARVHPAEDGEITATIWVFQRWDSDENGRYTERIHGFEHQTSEPVTWNGAQRATKHSALDTHAGDALRTDGSSWHHGPRQKELLTGTLPGDEDVSATSHVGTSRSACVAKTDDEIFAMPSDTIVGPVLLKLAETYSNTEILRRVNQTARGENIKSVNVITKRLTHAIEAKARSDGIDASAVRKHIKEVRQAKSFKSRR